MKYIILIISLIVSLGFFTTSDVFAQVDHLSSIAVLETGKIFTDKHEFQISNDMKIREFFDGKVIRISGHTVEGFPYIIYSKVVDEQVETRGNIFISGKFNDLMFEKPIITEEESQKKDELAIVIQYSSRVFERQYATISTKIFDQEENKINNFNQKTGLIPNVDIKITVLDGRNEEFFSTNGTTNDSGFFETRFWIPDNYPRDTLTVTIDAENENSKSSKLFQMYTMGKQ